VVARAKINCDPLWRAPSAALARLKRRLARRAAFFL
jgi:hypothetical protein